jgi:hypothetical protein
MLYLTANVIGVLAEMEDEVKLRVGPFEGSVIAMPSTGEQRLITADGNVVEYTPEEAYTYHVKADLTIEATGQQHDVEEELWEVIKDAEFNDVQINELNAEQVERTTA